MPAIKQQSIAPERIVLCYIGLNMYFTVLKDSSPSTVVMKTVASKSVPLE